MANSGHLEILQRGVDVWNQWRGAHPEILPDLKGADLRGMDLGFGNFNEADLSRADLTLSILENASLKGANLRNAILKNANIRFANFSDADLRGTHLSGVDRSGTVFSVTGPEERKHEYKRQGLFSGKEKVISGFVLVIALLLFLFVMNNLRDKASLATCMRHQANLKKAVSFYHARTVLEGQGRHPDSLQDLVTAGHLTKLPVCPSGGSYLYNPGSRTITCTKHTVKK